MQHVPQGETRELELLPFEDALRQALEPAPDYDVTRWLYVPKVYGEYRYVLGTRGKHPLICMGINPSTAIPDRLDNTLKSVERIALANGFDSFLMFNVYAQRATDPDAMELRCNERLHRENLRAFQYLLSLHPQPASGPPGAPSLKSGTTWPPAWPTKLPWAGPSAPGGSRRDRFPKKATPTTLCTSVKTPLWIPST